jgi:hypothetical protein
MPITRYDPKQPRRGFYDQRFSIRQVRQLEEMSADLEGEIHILRQQILILLGQIEGLSYYTDIDLNKLAMINRLVNTIVRLVRQGKGPHDGQADLDTLLDDLLSESEPWEGA